MEWNLESNGFKWYDIIPWIELSTGWSMKNRYETIFHRMYIIEWFGYKIEISRKITTEKWLKIKRKK